MTKALLLSTFFLTLAVVTPAVAAGGKTIQGRCFASVDGKVRVDNEPCAIRLEVGGGFAFAPLKDAFHVVPDREDGEVTGDGTAVWTSFDLRAGRTIVREFGMLERDGACWTSARARICAWTGAPGARKNRDARSTASTCSATAMWRRFAERH